MREERVLRTLPIIIFVLIIIPVVAIAFIIKSSLSNDIEVEDESPTIIENVREVIPVINESKMIILPFNDSGVKIGKNYYDYKGEEKAQEDSIIKQDNTYYQNTGIDYIKEEAFDVVAIANGTVSLVKDDDLLGKTVHIEHDNGLLSIYQSLSQIDVKKGDIITQGQIIGKSGTNKMDNELGNHLHFEIYENGTSKDPSNYLNKDYNKKN